MIGVTLVPRIYLVDQFLTAFERRVHPFLRAVRSSPASSQRIHVCFELFLSSMSYCFGPGFIPGIGEFSSRSLL